MSTDKTNDNDLDLEEFDSFIRSTLLTEGNKLRAEKGYPLLTEEDLADVHTISELKKQFGKIADIDRTAERWEGC